MELGKIAPLTADPVAGRVGAEAGPASALPLAPGDSGAASTGAPAALADELNIHPLDVAGALQILIAEVRASMTLPGDVPPGGGPPAARAVPAMPVTAVTAPLLLVQMLLQRLPDEENGTPAAWLATATRVEAALRSGMDKAVDAVMAWRNVPSLVVDVAKDARALVLAAVDDDPPNPLWMRPEWLGLAPRMERFWRRRRYARRNVRYPEIDPRVPEPYDPPRERDG